ncbi:MAG: iron-sulfur cluster assembly scaffold protein [Chloroflexales bacterium]|nr:iron-sulfur cluster assembly scaffold protein [Chloroflexales bacterium]
MDRQEAIDFLLEHYENPRNLGLLANADVVMPGGHPDCGDRVTLYLKIDSAGQRIERLTFEGQGCTLSQAAASILTELVAGMPLAQAAVLDGNDMIDRLGRDVVQSRPRCATLALDTLKAAIAQYQKAKV